MTGLLDLTLPRECIPSKKVLEDALKRQLATGAECELWIVNSGTRTLLEAELPDGAFEVSVEPEAGQGCRPLLANQVMCGWPVVVYNLVTGTVLLLR